MEDELKFVSTTVKNWIIRSSHPYKLIKYIIENGNDFVDPSEIEQDFPEIKGLSTILYDLARRGTVYQTELKHRPILIHAKGLGYKVDPEFKELIEDRLKSENEIKSVHSQDNETVFRERVVEEYVTNWFKNKGYNVIRQCVDDPTKFNDISQCKTHSIWGIDIVAQNSEDVKEKWIIEVKGEDKGGDVSGDVNWLLGLGQLLTDMKSFEGGIKYGIAIPHPSRGFINSMRRTMDSKAIQRLGINILLVKRGGEIIHIIPEEFHNFIEKL